MSLLEPLFNKDWLFILHAWSQGILKGKVSLYHWPPVWLFWTELYDNWQFFCFYLQNRLIQTSQTGGQQYSDTFLFSNPWWRLWRLTSINYFLNNFLSLLNTMFKVLTWTRICWWKIKKVTIGKVWEVEATYKPANI